MTQAPQLSFGATGDASGALFLGPIPEGERTHPAFDRTLLGPELWNLCVVSYVGW